MAFLWKIRSPKKCRLSFSLSLVLFSLFFVLAPVSINAEPVAASSLGTITANLDTPCGLAIQPGTGHLFVSANKTIFRLDSEKKSKTIEINGFNSDSFGKDPTYNIGALGLAFLSPEILIVGGGDQSDGSELLYFFEVGGIPLTQETVIKSNAAKFTSGPIKPGKDSEKGEGNFFGLAVWESQIFVTCNGDDSKGWISKINFQEDKPGPLSPFINSSQHTKDDAPAGIAISPEGKLIVSQVGELNLPGDSLLSIYDPKTGKFERSLPTGLNDLLAIAYSPTTGKLYGLDFSWITPERGGLFLLEPGEKSVKTTKVVSLDKPTAMVFSPEGTLYLSVLGTPPKVEGDAKPPSSGKVLAIYDKL